jgi:hypothetical protein
MLSEHILLKPAASLIFDKRQLVVRKIEVSRRLRMCQTLPDFLQAHICVAKLDSHQHRFLSSTRVDRTLTVENKRARTAPQEASES